MSVIVSQVSAVLPRDGIADFSEGALDAVMRGECGIQQLDSTDFDRVKVGAKMPTLEDLPPQMASVLDKTCQFAVLAGLCALQRAGLISRDSEEPWALPKEMRDSTGVIFTSSFSHHEAALADAGARAEERALGRVRAALQKHGVEDSVLAELEETQPTTCRKLALQLLLRANTQLAQIVKARGPNLYSSNSCASTTTAIKLAVNSIQLGEADRMIVIASDAPLSCEGHGALVDSFAQLGAATSAATIDEAVRPFQTGRSGFVFGDGAVAIIFEAPTAPCAAASVPPDVEVLSCRMANSAAAAATRLDTEHICQTLERAVDEACRKRNISRAELCQSAVYFSHETFTKLCANAEVAALQYVFGDGVKDIVISNTKALVGHAMGTNIEDAVAVLALKQGFAPRVSVENLDPAFEHLAFSDGGKRNFKFAIHLAAGIGNHLAIVVYAKISR